MEYFCDIILLVVGGDDDDVSVNLHDTMSGNTNQKMAKKQEQKWPVVLLKKILKILPPSTPAKIYRAVSVFPFLKKFADRFIKMGIPRILKIEEGELELDQSDVAVSGALALGSFEETEVKIFREKLKIGMTVIDIGANIGYYTIIAGKRVGANGKVLAFEPEENNLSLLTRNIFLNKINNVTVFKVALADKPGETSLYLDDNNKGHHSLSSQKSGTGKRVLVKTDTLDNILEKSGSLKVDLIKMDIEGAECLALEGMVKTLAINPDLILFTEFYPQAISRLGRSPLQFLKTMVKLGFFLSEIDENKKCLKKIDDLEMFVSNFPKGESFTNLYATRKTN